MNYINFNEKQIEFKNQRRKINEAYNEDVRCLQAELSAKVKKLAIERDRKLDDINREEARCQDDYYEFKRQQKREDKEYMIDYLAKRGYEIGLKEQAS